MHRDSRQSSKALSGMKMHPPYFPVPILAFRESAVIFSRRLLLHSAALTSGRKECSMKLKIRYENVYQEVEVNEKDTKGLFLNLGIEEDPDASQEENEARLQEEFDIQFNRPDYNNWHKETRHIDPTPKARRLDGKKGFITPAPGDTDFDVLENLVITFDSYDIEGYEYVCNLVKEALPKHPDWADIVIAIRIDGVPVKEYASQHQMSESSVSHKLARALKKLREIF